MDYYSSHRDHFRGAKVALTESYTFLTARAGGRARFPVFRFNFLSFEAIVVIVIDFPLVG